MTAEYSQGVSPKPDLSSLSGNVKAVEKVRERMKSGEGLSRNDLLGILRGELATMTDNKSFYLKARTLREVISGLEEHEEVEVEEILNAMGIQKHEESGKKGLFGRRQKPKI